MGVPNSRWGLVQVEELPRSGFGSLWLSFPLSKMGTMSLSTFIVLLMRMK